MVSGEPSSRPPPSPCCVLIRKLANARDEIGGIEQGHVVGAEVADGVEEIRKVVRRQIGRGADWIKLYAGLSRFLKVSD